MGFHNFGPMSGFLFGAGLLNVVLLVLWIVILVDCARRDFTNDIEKVCWIVAMLVAPVIGSVAYLAVIKYSNPNGIMKKDGTIGSIFKKTEPMTTTENKTETKPEEPKEEPKEPTPNTPMVTDMPPRDENI